MSCTEDQLGPEKCFVGSTMLNHVLPVHIPRTLFEGPVQNLRKERGCGTKATDWHAETGSKGPRPLSS